MTDIPTQAPTDSAVEPAGVSDKQAEAARIYVLWGSPDMPGGIQTSLLSLIASRQQLAELRKQLGQPVPLSEWQQMEQQLAEMRGALEQAQTTLTSDAPFHEVVRVALGIVGNALASPSQPSRGKCEPDCSLEPIHREAFDHIGPTPHIATLINNNQPGWTNIIETAPNVTIDVGAKLYDQKALFAVGVAMLEEGRKGGFDDGFIAGKAYQKHFPADCAQPERGECAHCGHATHMMYCCEVDECLCAAGPARQAIPSPALREAAKVERSQVIRECWEAINKHIKPGPLQGNGCDETAQRNGMILASNLLMKMFCAAFAEGK